MPMECAATCIRGPTVHPSSIALRRATSVKSGDPTTRMVVKPFISVRRAFSAPTMAPKPA